jgi:hypothetical protein
MHVAKMVDAPTDTVWKILIDTSLWPEWGPSISQVDFPERWIQKGVKGRVKTAIGIWVPFEITAFEAPVYWCWKVGGIPATGHRLKPQDPSHCKLIFEIPYGFFPYALICRRAAENIARLATRNLNF